MKFTDYLWHKINPIFQQITAHPYAVELGKGTLSQERFHFYIQQNVCYLVEYSKVLALIAGRAFDVKMMHYFLTYAMSALEIERDMRSKYLREFEDVVIERTPACVAYTQYLKAKATTACLEEAIAAIFPCFILYKELGEELAKNLNSDNPYCQWIQHFIMPEYLEYTEQVMAIINEMSEQVSQKMRNLMERAYETSSLYEWHFWNDAYHMTIWRQTYVQKDSLNNAYALI